VFDMFMDGAVAADAPVHLLIVSRSHEAAEQSGNEVAGYGDDPAGAELMPGCMRFIIVSTPACHPTSAVSLVTTVGVRQH